MQVIKKGPKLLDFHVFGRDFCVVGRSKKLNYFGGIRLKNYCHSIRCEKSYLMQYFLSPTEVRSPSYDLFCVRVFSANYVAPVFPTFPRFSPVLPRFFPGFFGFPRFSSVFPAFPGFWLSLVILGFLQFIFFSFVCTMFCGSYTMSIGLHIPSP